MKDIGFYRGAGVQIPNYSPKLYKQSQQECELMQVIGGHFCYCVNKYYLVVSVCYLPNKRTIFYRFLKYLFSLYKRWSNILGTVCFHSIQLSCLFEGH